MNVLIADPSSSFRDWARRAVAVMGASESEGVRSRAELVERCGSHDVDVVLLSREILGRGPWIERLETLCAKLQDCRVVLVTLFAEREYDAPARKAGAVAVVSRERWMQEVPQLLASWAREDRRPPEEGV